MAKRKNRKMARVRTVTVYSAGKVGYYSRDRVEGGASPTYSTLATLEDARRVRGDADAAGSHVRWPAPL